MGWRGVLLAVAAGPLGLIGCGDGGASGRRTESLPKRPIVSELLGHWELDVERTLEGMMEERIRETEQPDPAPRVESRDESRRRFERRIRGVMVVLELRSDGRADLTLGDPHGLLRSEAAWRPRPGGAVLQGEGGILDLELDAPHLWFASDPASCRFYLKRR